MRRAAGVGAIVVLGVALATALTEASFALGAELSFEWYLAAIACVAWWRGRAPAVVATALASVVLDSVFLPVHGFTLGMGLTDAVRLLIFLGVALLVAHLVSARERAETERAGRERLVTMVAHALGSLITALRTWTAALQGVPRSPEQLEVAARALGRTIDSIAKLAGDLGDWASVVVGGAEVEPVDVDLAELVHDVIHAVRADAARRGVRISWSLAPTRVRADPDRLRHVTVDLLTSLLRATHPGGEVLVSVRAAEGRGLLSVCGPGATGWSRARGRRVHHPGPLAEPGGLRLGLALTHDLVRAQGGQLTVHDDGAAAPATFSIALPAAGAGIG